MSEQWIDELKVGDRVIVRMTVGFNDNVPDFGKVTNITAKTRVITVTLNNGRKIAFNSFGTERATGYHKANLEQFTPEKEAQIAKERGRLSIINRMKKYDWDKLTYDQARKIAEVIRGFEKEGNEKENGKA